MEAVAAYLGVGNVTVHRWCRHGRLPGFRIGRLWGVRRRALEEPLRRKEQPRTLAGRLGGLFIEVPDNIFGIAQSVELMHRMDAAFFKVGEARGGVLINTPQTPRAPISTSCALSLSVMALRPYG